MKFGVCGKHCPFFPVARSSTQLNQEACLAGQPILQPVRQGQKPYMKQHDGNRNGPPQVVEIDGQKYLMTPAL